jgi:hypothetical protein
MTASAPRSQSSRRSRAISNIPKDSWQDFKHAHPVAELHDLPSRIPKFSCRFREPDFYQTTRRNGLALGRTGFATKTVPN